jgi:hypothetical protein
VLNINGSYDTCLRHVRNTLAHKPVLDERHARGAIGAKGNVDLELLKREHGLHEVAPLRLVELSARMIR